MLDLGTLRIGIQADTEDAKGKLKGFQQQTEQTEKKNDQATKRIASAWSVMVGNLLATGVEKVFQSIAKHLDSAIKRVDTLNNYPKVMQSLGYSAEDASANINKLSDGLQGLPTALDDAVAYQQRLTASFGDINKGTDAYLALNNMILAGGASTQVASSAMEQFVQMISQGTVDMQAWRSVLNACPGQMKQLAESMLGTGKSADDLYEAIKNNEISMDDLLGAVVRLNQEGGEGFDSFEQQARNATGGIETSMANLDTAISRGIANFIDAIGQDRIASAFQSIIGIVNNVASVITATLAPVINWIIDNFDAIAPIVVGVATAFIALGTAMMISDIIGVLNGSLQATNGILKMVAGSQALLNAVMNMNPIVLIISLIAGLIAGLILLYNTNEDFANFVNACWEGIVSVVGACIDAIVQFFQNLWQGILDLISWFQLLATDPAQALDQMVAFVGQAIDQVGQFFMNLVPLVMEWLGMTWNFIVEWGANVLTTIFETVGQWLSAFLEFLPQVPELFLTWLGMALANLITWAGEVIVWAMQTGAQFLQNIISFFQQLPGNIQNFLSSALSNIISWGAQMIAQAIQTATNFVQNIISRFQQLPGQLLQIGKNMIQGLVNGITSMAGAVWNAITSVCSNVVDTAKSLLGINSPSKVFAEIGRYTMEGFEDGIDAGTKYAVNAVRNSAKQLTNAFNPTFGADYSITNPTGLYTSNGVNVPAGKATIYNFNVNGINVATSQDEHVIANIMTNKLLELQRLARI